MPLLYRKKVTKTLETSCKENVVSTNKKRTFSRSVERKGDHRCLSNGHISRNKKDQLTCLLSTKKRVCSTSPYLKELKLLSPKNNISQPNLTRFDKKIPSITKGRRRERKDVLFKRP